MSAPHRERAEHGHEKLVERVREFNDEKRVTAALEDPVAQSRVQRIGKGFVAKQLDLPIDSAQSGATSTNSGRKGKTQK